MRLVAGFCPVKGGTDVGRPCACWFKIRKRVGCLSEMDIESIDNEMAVRLHAGMLPSQALMLMKPVQFVLSLVVCRKAGVALEHLACHPQRLC